MPADPNLQAVVIIVGGIVTCVTILGQCLNAYIAYLAAQKVQAVKADLAASVTHTDGKLDVIHALVNAAMTAQLKINAEQAWRIAHDHPMDESAKAAALAAAKLYHDQVDGQKPGGLTP